MSVNLTIQLPFRTVRAIQGAGSNKSEVARNLNVDEAVIDAIALLDATPVSEDVKLDDTAIPDAASVPDVLDAAPVSEGETPENTAAPKAASIRDGGRLINITIRDDRGFRKKEHDVRMHDSWSVSQLKQWIRTAGIAKNRDMMLRFGGRPLGSSQSEGARDDQRPLSFVSTLYDETFGWKAVQLRVFDSMEWAAERQSCCFASRSLQISDEHDRHGMQGRSLERAGRLLGLTRPRRVSRLACRRFHVKVA